MMPKPKMKLGTITFGKSRPAPKAVLVDVTMDDKTQQELHKAGLKLLAKDSEAVIEYVIRKALQYVAKK
jgi:hypothetical protein